MPILPLLAAPTDADRARASLGAAHTFAPKPSALPLAGVHRVVLDEPRRLERMQRLELPGDRVDDTAALVFVAADGAPAAVARERAAGGGGRWAALSRAVGARRRRARARRGRARGRW